MGRVSYTSVQNNGTTFADDDSVGSQAWVATINAAVSDNVFTSVQLAGTSVVVNENSIKIVKAGTIQGDEKSASSTLPQPDAYLPSFLLSSFFFFSFPPSPLPSSPFFFFFSFPSSPFLSLLSYINFNSFLYLSYYFSIFPSQLVLSRAWVRLFEKRLKYRDYLKFKYQ